MTYELSVTPVLGGSTGITYFFHVNSPESKIPDGKEWFNCEDILSVEFTFLKADLADLAERACVSLERGEPFSVKVELSDAQVSTLLA
jgi:hypothetical protein